MKVKVNENCIGCGLCASLCPDVFCLTGEGVAEARSPIPAASEPAAQEAADSCPVSAIETE